VRVRVEKSGTLFTNLYETHEILRMPVAHGEGRYVASRQVLDSLENDGRVIFRYADAQGNTNADANPNGSERNIAGIINEGGNVLGMMPHPERACSPLIGSTDGVRLLESILARVAA
jgi:phosphoribosylformylglycinamidine (FGAM) synthase-like amidotransferase family enzyme